MSMLLASNFKVFQNSRVGQKRISQSCGYGSSMQPKISFGKGGDRCQCCWRPKRPALRSFWGAKNVHVAGCGLAMGHVNNESSHWQCASFLSLLVSVCTDCLQWDKGRQWYIQIFELSAPVNMKIWLAGFSCWVSCVSFGFSASTTWSVHKT